MKIELIDYDDNGMHKVARLARATRKNEIDEDNIHQSSKDDDFIKALIKVKHLGVLEHINFTFHVSEISRCLTHQLVRHRMASYLQMSNRHAKPNEEDYIIPPTLKDVASTEYSPTTEFAYKSHMKAQYEYYKELINNGVPIEDARYVLPPAFFTHISMSMNARTLLHFLELRLHPSAQWEIRSLACKIFDIVYDLYPIIFESVKELREKNE